MRKLLFIFGFLAFFSCKVEEKIEDHSAMNKYVPYEHMNFKRNFPDNNLDIKAFNKAYQKSFSQQHKSTNDEEWTQIGPKNIGGRLNCIAVHPTNQDIILVGNSTGGVFRTEDGGDNWEPITEEFDYLSVGAITFDPNDPEIIYVGSGDPNIGGLPHPGNGVYKSINGGDTWQHIGLEEERIISKIIINPLNTDVIYAGAMGVPYEENEFRGLYRSIDAGETWEQILFVAEGAGIIDMEINPNNPDIIYASSWNRVRNNTISTINGPDAHIYKTIDGGDNWVLIENGLPEGDKGRIGLAMSGLNPDIIYSIIVGVNSQIQGLYRSNNGGEDWGSIPIDESLMFNALGGFGWYFGQIRVSPYDDNEISILGVDMYTTENGGDSWMLSVPVWWMYAVHADKHDMIYLDENTILLATDGGLYKTTNHFGTWEDIDDIPNTQLYRIGLNPHQPNFYTGGAQDNGTTTGNLDSINHWNRDYGGDGFQPIFDPIDPTLRYAMTQNGNMVYRQGFDWWQGFNDGIAEEDRRNWDTPLIMSTHDNSIMYTGTFRVYINQISPDGIWSPISDDLTDGDIFGEAFHTISTVAESETQLGLLYAGTTDGNVWRRMDEDSEWENITDGLPERYVTNIKTSKEDQAIVYVSQSGFKDNDQTAHFHKSIDNGSTWIDITGDLPEQPINHIDIVNDSIYFIASDFGVYYTETGGDEWFRLGNNMPLIPVYDIEVDTVNKLLVAGTFARSMWTIPVDSILDYAIEDTDTLDISVSNYDVSKIKVFPNPANDFISVRGLNSKKDYQIWNSEGKVVLAESCHFGSQKINIGKLNEGLYFLHIVNENIVLKFVVY